MTLTMASLTFGYALCTPSGALLGLTYRETQEQSIAVVFPNAAAWYDAKERGYSVRRVLANIMEAEESDEREA